LKRLFLLLVAAVAVLVAPTAFAGAPTFDRIAVNETFEDEFLTDACGVPVSTRVQGDIIVRTFAGEGTGVAQVTTINIGVTAMAGDNTFTLRDVGADVTRIEPDGTVILLITGQVPFAFTGALKVDPETDEVILEPQHNTEGQVEDACAALTA
jgi:hypothetical protein